MQHDKVRQEQIVTIEDYLRLVKNSSNNFYRGHANGIAWRLEPKIVRMFNNRYLLSKYQHQTWGGLERSIS